MLQASELIELNMLLSEHDRNNTAIFEELSQNLKLLLIVHYHLQQFGKCYPHDWTEANHKARVNIYTFTYEHSYHFLAVTGDE